MMTTSEAASRAGFAFGDLVTLRPVLEPDLPRLAELMSANPGEPDRQPWTPQRLKHKFEDKDSPGMWDSKNRKYSYAVLRSTDNELSGYIHEREDWHSDIYWCHFHIDQQLPDANELSLDLLKAYLKYKLTWHQPLRISFSILGCEEAKAQQLIAAGYELELSRERMVLWLGRPQAICTYTWLSERLLAELAANGAVQ